MWLWLIGVSVLFLIGAVLGSFLHVVIERTLRSENWTSGFSRCDHCQKNIAWFDKIPLLSFVILRGKCRHCHQNIVLSHWFMELLFGALFVWWGVAVVFFLHLSQAPFSYIQPIFWLLVGLVLLAIVVIDYSHYIIPDELVLALTLLAFTYRIGLVAFNIMQKTDLLTMTLAAFGASLGLLVLFLLTRGKGMGLGDVKLVFPLTLLVGWPAVVVLFFTAFIMGAIVGLVLVGTGQKKLKQAIPFGPFLVAGAFVSLVWGDLIMTWYLSHFFG